MCSTSECTRPARNNRCSLCQACYRRQRRLHDPEVAEAARASVRRAIAKKRGTPCLPRAERFPELTKDQCFERYLRASYGIDLAAYNQMKDDQGGVCAICEKPDTSKKQKLHVDHNHATGHVRGLLCHNCNVGLGAFRDSEPSLLKAIDYLKKK